MALNLFQLDAMVAEHIYQEATLTDRYLNNFYRDVHIKRRDFVENLIKTAQGIVRRNLEELDNPIENRWFIHPAVGTAVYGFFLNLYVVSAQWLYPDGLNFDLRNPVVINYATAGYVSGHELMHGLDGFGKGYQFDEQGKFVGNIYSPESWDAFREREMCIIEQYSEYDVPFTNGTKISLMLVSCLENIGARKICGPYKWGKRFLFAIPGHFQSSYENHPVSYNISLTIISKEKGSVSIRARGQNISRSYGITEGETSIPLPGTLVQAYGQTPIQRKGIRILSSRKISAKLIVAGQYATYRQTYNGYRYNQIEDWTDFEGEVELFPEWTYSRKYIMPYSGTLGIQIVAMRKTGFNITYEHNGTLQLIEGTLRKLDSFLLNDTFSSGIKFISSDAPVAVYYNAIADDSTDYQYVTQLVTAPPGRKYILPASASWWSFRAVALHDGTIIKVNRESRTYNMMLNEGGYIQSTTSEFDVGLNSNKDILVIGYNPQSDDIYGPVFSPIPSISQYCIGYIMDVDSDHDLAVVVKSVHKDDFVFHERDIPWWKQMSYFIMNDTEYFVAKTRLSKGDTFRKIYLRDRNATFGGFLDSIPLGL